MGAASQSAVVEYALMAFLLPNERVVKHFVKKRIYILLGNVYSRLPEYKELRFVNDKRQDVPRLLFYRGNIPQIS